MKKSTTPAGQGRAQTESARKRWGLEHISNGSANHAKQTS